MFVLNLEIEFDEFESCHKKKNGKMFQKKDNSVTYCELTRSGYIQLTSSDRKDHYFISKYISNEKKRSQLILILSFI